MLKFFRAASVVAVSCTLVATVIAADAGFAFGNDQNTSLDSNTIVIDAAQITAEQAQLDLAKSGKVKATLAENGDIIYVPGNGGMPKMDPRSPDVNSNSDDDMISASSLAELVRVQDVDDSLSHEERCLAGAVYFESKGESLTGQLAVARVVLARANSGRFPKTLCGVVFQKSQFSFVRGADMPPIPTGSKNWRHAVAISKIALNNSWKSPVEGALFFHARHVSPGWRLTRIGSVDNHIFYR
ncbi:cell wall hydrolase [Sphingorhabdus sp.]|uniref:cell wall hydrolase n=1 Tax=Sphingorhabdus sp. TaxID=1902408 RepID=UPI003918949E